VRGDARTTRRSAGRTEQRDRSAPGRDGALELQERVARERRWLTLTHAHDGTVAIRGKLDAESGALISGVLEPLAAPAPATDGTPDLRDAGVRYADALVQICQVAASQLPDVRSERPTMLVTVGLETLENRIGCTPGYLDTAFRFQQVPPAKRRVTRT
jgi:Domain of unknown function (DUF222)